ncbi:bifunctional DedA family/phosphatase PAP2 family protein [Larsenimonas salina]|uniref:bifunctional DedA family/phosphatase PAP2 family protein n=1 Tax=Larsenimonas salina TaxID=1295565 RepID=UPI002072DBBE|nr:bifunctional DedA family/phosphatase PAP2 family protein [Larsenimonas salina]MCM5703351.1 bifunctional DedA family/phosphatase PAP2 family protein [Larsenimonas salina]
MDVMNWLEPLARDPLLLFAALGLVALLESLALVGLAFPGVVVIAALASLAGHDSMSVPLALAFAAAGAVLGDAISFWLGHRYRHRVASVWPLSRYPEALEKGQRFFERYGATSVVLGRFIGPLRPVIPLIAGMCNMPSTRFFVVNVASALAWAPVYVLPGYYLGRTWKAFLGPYQESFGWLLALGGVLIFLAWMFTWGRQHAERMGALYRLALTGARRSKWGRRTWLSFRMNVPGGAPPIPSLTLFLASATGFGVLAVIVAHHPAPFALDHNANAFFKSLDVPLASQLALVLAKVGDKLGIVILLAPWTLWLIWQRYGTALLHWALAIGGIGLANILFKAWVGRPRPMTPDYLEGSFSFPSAHTSGAVVVYGLAAAFMADGVKSPARRHWIYCGATLLIALMAWSRLMMGVHWVSDLLGGTLLGFAMCAVVRISYHRFAYRPITQLPWKALGAATVLLMATRVLFFPPV